MLSVTLRLSINSKIIVSILVIKWSTDADINIIQQKAIGLLPFSSKAEVYQKY